MKQLINKVEQWFINRNLHTLNGAGQLTKLSEEVGELEDAFITDDRAEEIDAVGDILVVLIGYCMQRDLGIMDCLASAYEEIKDRKGKVIDGVFVKEADLQSVDNTVLCDDTKDNELRCPYCSEELAKVSASTYTCQVEGCLGYLSDFMVLK